MKQASDGAAAVKDAWDTESEEAEELPQELVRAWRAAIVSLGFCPVLLNVYSAWLLWKNRFFVDMAGHCNWRVVAATAINVFVFGLLAMVLYGILARGPSYSNAIPDEMPYSLPVAPGSP